MKEFNILEQIAVTASKKEKESIIRENASEVLCNLLKYTYNPFLTFRVKQLDYPDKYNVVQPDISLELFQLLDLLAAHTVTPTQARGMIKRLLAKCTEDGAKWVARVIDRDLKIGCGVSTINKAVPGLIPEFKVMLAHPMVEPKSGESNWHRVNYPCEGSIKADGTRIIAVCNSVTVKYYSREGIEQDTLDHLTPQILALRPGTSFVLDGEGHSLEYIPSCKTAKKNYEQGKNWKFAQSRSMISSSLGTYTPDEMKRGLGYIVWDLIDYDYFLSNGLKGTCKPYKYRRMELAGLFERTKFELTGLVLMESRLLKTKEETIAYFKEARSRGEEGIMVKDINSLYEFKRSYLMLKMKEFYTADLRIIDCIEGTKGTKYEGSLGAILVSDDDKISGKLMGGWDDEEGLAMWFRHKRGEMVGNIVECIYLEITADNSLRHGVFVNERPDKNEISWG